eukprot:jgi/Picsp_1/1167/NSC_04648-R1_dj-1 family protein
MGSASKKVLVPIADGSEEMEAVIVIDVLRRAGADVIVASTGPGTEVKCSRGVKIVADKLIQDCSEDYDLVVLPGGMPGAENLRDSEPLVAILKSQKVQSKPLAAICASPAVVFEPQGLLDGLKATSHPAFSDKLTNQDAVLERVVADGSMITSRGPGTAFEFALALVKMLYGDKKMHDVANPMVMHSGWDASI